MHILFIIVAGLLGAAAFDTEGVLFGAVIGYLVAEVLTLKKRVTRLERQAASDLSAMQEEVVFAPVDEPGDFVMSEATVEEVVDPLTTDIGKRVQVPPDPTKQEGRQEHHEETLAGPDRLFAMFGKVGSDVGDWVSRFITGGNLVLKMGLVILFFGVAFLVKYAAQHNLVPIELRLAGAALGGMVLLGLGWRLRSRTGGYGLGLQGGGVGILYLVVYGAAKLYSLVPVPLSFGLMIALVVLSGFLAVLQNARMLAVFGAIGGFIAPVLMSTGTGSHVMLFSYFGLLNIGILGIAWYKAWRELNLLGFFFTFGIGTLWGSQGYQPQHFATTEPFLIFFFLLYAAISVLFAHRQPVNLRGFIDGPLVFGLPLVATGLQYALVRDFQYGMAISSCSLGVFYLLLATILWRRLAEGMRMLCEAFLALGVMFATMTIPLALDSTWTSAVWALEGGAMVWVGVRQKRLLARLFGVLLQFVAAYLFLAETFYPFGAIPFLNRSFFGCLFIAGAALFASFSLQRHADELRKWEKYVSLPLLVWGLCWWYFGGLRECDHHFGHIRIQNAVLLFSSASTILMTIVAVKVSWRQLAIAQAVHLVLMALSMVFGLFDMPYNSHLLASWGPLAWAVAFYCQYRMLYQFDHEWPEWLMGYWHAKSLWLLLLLSCLEISWLADEALQLSEIWAIIGWGVLPASVVLLIMGLGGRPAWPLARWERYYRGVGIGLPALLLMIWSVLCLKESGDPAPLPFVPLINPLELSLLFIIMVLMKWASACRRGSCYGFPFLSERIIFWLVAALIFIFTNGTVARCVHFFGNIPYRYESLYHSVVFQAAIAALWSLGALSMTVWAARAGNRLVWCCGAVLLALVVVKLFLVDLSGTGTVARIVSFIVVGILMLVIGYFSPIPPGRKEEVI
ncbi:Uncharacterized membrane protein [Desulfopila aestuarii DSM 18488]|uniref:Uncharacterized membrane protein n=2 Tax=Desulfopila aestuarii TaxID=231440 RepID=A0A1M7Y898_9BACT|nr:Uncharacterized membrane protein [Desulfopila aestuarii DSM 18488]